MSGAERLLSLIQLLRGRRRPVSGHARARQLGVMQRTLYSKNARRQAQDGGYGGEPGLGYLLKRGFGLPPLRFRPDEIGALELG